MKLKTDFLFTLLLFCVFAISAFSLVVIGAGVYETSVSSMEQNFEGRTALAYVAEKVRQNDNGASILAEENVLRITTEDVDGSYTLYIYEHEGFLTELFTRTELPFDMEAGRQLLKVQSFSVSEREEGLLEISTTEEGEEPVSLFLHLKSEGA
ncbi:MAG: DUF4860 domain-containing protein [Lachnospiraceae bacterium]|nr:DUF4860 domain-containing protein [Lachnospiraceae bacterium]